MNRSNQSTASLATNAAIALGAAVAVLYVSSETLSRWILTPDQLARYRAARYRCSRFPERTIATLSRKPQVLADQDAINRLVGEIFHKNKNHQRSDQVITEGSLGSSLRIERLEQDQRGEYVICFIRSSGEALYVPLVPFCRAVLDSNQIYTTTLCFLYDATGGQDHIVMNLLRIDPSVTTSLSRPPLWMKQWSTDLHVSKEHKNMILQSLVRVEASLLLMAKAPPTAKSVVFPISTEYVSVLMAALFSVFPDDKHVFLYTGCIQAVAKPGPVPLKPLVSIHMRTTEFHRNMARLPYSVAASVETWMAAVDTLILLQDDFLTNGFLPYVCRLDYLLHAANSTERKWAVRSLLQYCAASDKHAEAAVKTLQTESPKSPLSSTYAKEIDSIVFCHKRILIAHKTMPDTVSPVEHWALKQQGGPGGCACCMEDEEAADERLRIEQKVESIMARSLSNSYVDGKIGFAFDPSRFA